MPKIPILPSPLPDELLYSYFLRMSTANGFESFAHLKKHYLQKNKTVYAYDIRDDLYPFAKSVTGEHWNQVLSFYLKMSLFHGIAPMSSRTHMSRYVGLLSRYRNQTKIIKSGEFMVQELRFCPQCQKDEFNQYDCFYYHRAHQMPGVTVCHTHGCALHVYEGALGAEMKLPLRSRPLSVHEKSLEYAIFCKSFLDSELECDVSNLRTAMMQKLTELKFDPRNNTLRDDMKEYLPLMKHLPIHIIQCRNQKK